MTADDHLLLGAEVVQVEDLVLDVEIPLPLRESLEVLVNEVVQGVLLRVFDEVAFPAVTPRWLLCGGVKRGRRTTGRRRWI